MQQSVKEFLLRESEKETNLKWSAGDRSAPGRKSNVRYKQPLLKLPLPINTQSLVHSFRQTLKNPSFYLYNDTVLAPLQLFPLSARAHQPDSDRKFCTRRRSGWKKNDMAARREEAVRPLMQLLVSKKIERGSSLPRGRRLAAINRSQ